MDGLNTKVWLLGGFILFLLFFDPEYGLSQDHENYSTFRKEVLSLIFNYKLDNKELASYYFQLADKNVRYTSDDYEANKDLVKQLK
jgi:hypothetical protein